MNLVVAASDGHFREYAGHRLLDAGLEEARQVSSPSALAGLLLNERGVPGGRPLIVVGGHWLAARPFLRVAVTPDSDAVVLLDSPDARNEQEALGMGAGAILHLDVPTVALAAGITAVMHGLLVLDRPRSHSRSGTGHDGNSSATTRQDVDERDTRIRRLTARERQILALVASGTSNKGIARTLGVSANTVKFHLAAAFEKLDAATRAEAVAAAIRRGELAI